MLWSLIGDFWHWLRHRNDPPPPMVSYPLPWCEGSDRQWCGIAGDCVWGCWQIPEDEYDQAQRRAIDDRG